MRTGEIESGEWEESRKVKVEIHLDNLDILDSLARTVVLSLSSIPAYPYAPLTASRGPRDRGWTRGEVNGD